MGIFEKIIKYIKKNKYLLRSRKSAYVFLGLIVLGFILNMSGVFGLHKDSDMYNIMDGDYLSQITSKDLTKVSQLIVVGEGSYRDVLIKATDKNKIDVYRNLDPSALDFFNKNTLTPYLEKHSNFNARYMNSYEGVSKRLGVQSDPEKLIKAKENAVIFKTVGSIITQIIIFGCFVWAIYYFQNRSITSAIRKHMPRDIKDSIYDLVGNEEIIKEVLQIEDMYLNRKLYEKYNIVQPFNIMLTGPAGTGKTQIARCMAKALNVPIYYCSAGSLQSGYVGGGSRALSKLAKSAAADGRAIIFIDEAESLLQNRLHGAQHWEKETINTLLSLLDGVNSKNSDTIWILASNMDETKTSMDEAMLRRFPLKINFRLPNFEVRKQILDIQLSQVDPNLVSDDVDTKNIAAMAAGMSPALLKNLINRASLIAVQDGTIITQEILTRAFERVSVGLTDRDATHGQDESRLVIARHEVGHFLIKMHYAIRAVNGNLDLLAENIDVIKISTESISKFNALGFVLSKPSDNKLFSRSEYEEMIMTLYGGTANEELYSGDAGVTAGAADDIRKATEIIKLIVCTSCLYTDIKLNLNSDKEPTQDQLELMQELSRRLYSETKDILGHYRTLSDILVKSLMDNYVLTIDQAIEVIRKNMGSYG